MNYQENAQAWATKHGVKLTILSQAYRPHFPEDSKSRYVFKCRLSRGRNSYTFDFGQSFMNGCKEPTMYDVLACLTKNDPGTFVEFGDNYGYDSFRDADRVYKAIVKEYKGVSRVLGELLDDEELLEIA